MTQGPDVRLAERSLLTVANIAEAGSVGTDAKASVAAAETSLAAFGVCNGTIATALRAGLTMVLMVV